MHSQRECTLESPPYIFRQSVTHDCASFLDSIAKKTYCSRDFSHDTSLHQHSIIFTLVNLYYFINRSRTEAMQNLVKTAFQKIKSLKI